jgi:hypothetical protein
MIGDKADVSILHAFDFREKPHQTDLYHGNPLTLCHIIMTAGHYSHCD